MLFYLKNTELSSSPYKPLHTQTCKQYVDHKCSSGMAIAKTCALAARAEHIYVMEMASEGMQ